MTVSTETEAEIRLLHFGEHLPMGTIATQLGIHVDVVSRVIGHPRPRKPVSPHLLLVNPFQDFIAQTLERYPRLRATRLYDMIRPRGYQGSVRTLRDYVKEVRPTPKHEAFLRLSPLIGEQAQVDWAHVGDIAVPGGHRSLWLFVIVLAYSRALWAEFVLDLSVWSLLRSLSRACLWFGGTPREWLFDNPKIVVLERHGSASRFHPLLLNLAGHYAVRLSLCAVRKANQKGCVERHIRYLRDRFLAARTIRSIEQGNRELLAFIDEIALPRPHPTLTDRTVCDCFHEEQKRLLPLPLNTACVDQILSVRVDKTAFCRFDKNCYSVGHEHVRKTLTLVADDREVRLLDGATPVTRHERCWGRHQVIELPEHREALLAFKKNAKQPKGRDRLRSQIPNIDTLYERWVDVGRHLGSMTTRTLKLLDLYGPTSLAVAVQQVLERGLNDPGAIASLCEQQRCAQKTPIPVDVPLAAHIQDRDVIPHNLEIYDAKP